MARIRTHSERSKDEHSASSRGNFDFLGYTFGPHCFKKKDGWWYVGESPSKKSLARLRLKVADCLRRHSLAPWPEVRDDLNMILRGWSNYFRYGTTLFAYRAVDNYVYAPVDCVACVCDVSKSGLGLHARPHSSRHSLEDQATMQLTRFASKSAAPRRRITEELGRRYASG